MIRMRMRAFGVLLIALTLSAGCSTVGGVINSVIVKIGLPEPQGRLQSIAVKSVPNTLACLATRGLMRVDAIGPESAQKSLDATDAVNAALKSQTNQVGFRGFSVTVGDVVDYVTVVADVANEAEGIVSRAAGIIRQAQAENRDLTQEEMEAFWLEYENQHDKLAELIASE